MPESPAPRHHLWGRVLDADGGAPPRSVIYWIDGAHSGPALPLDLHPVGWSDREGRFFAQDLPAGECLLVADCESYGAGIQGARSSGAMRLTLPLPEGQDEVELRYPVSRTAFATITGRAAAAEDGRPLRGHPVVLLDTATAGGKFRQETRTDREGDYGFAWIPPGKYSVGLPGTLARLADGLTLKDSLPAGAHLVFSFQARKRPPGQSGYAAAVRCVDEAGAPVAGAEVFLRAMNFHALPVLTGEDGFARVKGYPVLPIGAMATKAGFMTIAGPLTTTGGGPAEAVLVLKRQAVLRVVVQDATTGDPLRRARIAVEHPGGVAENIDALLRPPRDIPPDGGFDLEVLPGPAVVSAAYPGYRPDESPFEVPAGEAPGPLVLRLQPGKASP